MSPITFTDIAEKRVTIERYLAVIGWKLQHHGCDHWYFYNHKGRCTRMFLLFPETDARICYEAENTNGNHSGFPSFTFYLKDLTMELLDDNCVSFCGKQDRSIFILCPNYDKKEPGTQLAKQRTKKKPQTLLATQLNN